MKKIILSISLFASLQLFAQNNICRETLIEDHFESLNSAWTFTGNKVFFNTNSIKFDYSYGMEENRAIRQLPRTISDTYFKVETKFSIDNPNPSGKGAIANVFSLTENSEDFATVFNNNTWLETDNNGLALVLLSDSYTDDDQANWFFLLETKLGTVRTWDMATKIYADPNISQYFVVFERTATNQGQLAIYSDVAHTSHIAGSPQTIEIDPLINNLNYTQNGGFYSANENRTVSASIDDLIICDNIEPLAKIETQTMEVSDLILFPNPSQDILNIKTSENLTQINIFSMDGKLVKTDVLNLNSINIADLQNGEYIVECVFENSLVSKRKFVKE